MHVDRRGLLNSVLFHLQASGGFFTGRLRPSEDTDVYITTRNSSNIPVKK